MKARQVLALILKDWRELSRTPQVLVPLVMLPLVFAVLLPAMGITIAAHPELHDGSALFRDVFAHLPGEYAGQPVRGFVLLTMAPLFLMIPIVVATVVATASFVGEKDRDTLEGLLFTPLSDAQLVLGKISATWILAVAVTWLSFLAYVGVVLGLAHPQRRGWFFPTASWLGLIVVVAPLVSLFAMCWIVLISQRSSSLQGAQAVSGLLVLPVVFLIVAQSSGLLVFGVTAIAWVGLLTAVADLAMVALVIRLFNRDRLVARL